MEQRLEGKVCLVTGATRGLGQAAALELARQGAEVLIIGRSSARIDQTLALLREQSGNANVRGFQADLSSQCEVLRVAREVRSWYPALDVLINNVGATLLSYQTSPDGLEMTWSLNYLNHFLLTHALLDELTCAARLRGEARVIEVTSSIHRLFEKEFFQHEARESYHGVRAYARSKRAMIMFAHEFSRRYAGTGVTVNAVTPGLVKTGIAAENGWFWRAVMGVIDRFALPLEKGVQPIVRLAVDPALRGVSGRYFNKFNALPLQPHMTDEKNLRRLWQISLDALDHRLEMCAG